MFVYHIIVVAILIKILVIRTDKSVFFISGLWHVRVTHWKPIQKLKLKLVNIFKSFSQHNHRVYFRQNFCFISSKLYLNFSTQQLICAAPIHCKIYRTEPISYSMKLLLAYEFYSFFGSECILYTGLNSPLYLSALLSQQ